VAHVRIVVSSVPLAFLQVLEAQLGVVPDHTATDWHLFTGYAASLLACGGAAYAYLYPNQDTRLVLAACLLGYAHGHIGRM
jgi:hypothetical protein